MPTRRTLIAGLASAPVLAGWVAQAAGLPEVYAHKGIAIRGYDPVAYFVQGRPVPGRRDQSVLWQGAEWRFATRANLVAFQKNPEAYAPKYGGYCAYAVSRGYTAKTDPAAWRIVDGHLYLNYSLSVRELWERDRTSNIARADANWPDVLTR